MITADTEINIETLSQEELDEGWVYVGSKYIIAFREETEDDY